MMGSNEMVHEEDSTHNKQEAMGGDMQSAPANSAGDAEEMETRMSTARGMSAVFGVCAEALINKPTGEVLADLKRVAHVFNDTRFDGFEACNSLDQRYYNRFFVSASPYFVPLMESCIRTSWVDEKRHYGLIGSTQSDHVLRCYKAAGFDFSALEGFGLAVDSLRVDSLAAELAFLSFLKNSEAQATSREGAHHCAELSDQFLREHLSLWIAKAAECLAETDDDLYARVAAFAAEMIELSA